MKQKINQKGFAALEAVLIIVIAGVIGGTGYYVYHASKKANNTYDATSKTDAGKSGANGGKGGAQGDDHAQTGPAKSEILIITEWGVSAEIPTPPDQAALIQHHIMQGVRPESAQFTTQQLIDADKDCTVDRAPGGVISRAPANDPFYFDSGAPSGKTVAQQLAEGSIKPYKKVGNYYYWYTAAQAACGNTAHAQELQKAAANEVKQIVTHLEQGT